MKALVNAVDHLGTVAYKLNDLLGQQTTEISATELRAASVAQVQSSTLGPQFFLSNVYINFLSSSQQFTPFGCRGCLVPKSSNLSLVCCSIGSRLYDLRLLSKFFSYSHLFRMAANALMSRAFRSGRAEAAIISKNNAR